MNRSKWAYTLRLKSTFLCAFMTFILVQTSWAQPSPTAHTEYNSEGDFFHTKGEVAVSVGTTVLGKIAADFAKYRDWGLHDINKKAGGEPFSILFRDVVYIPGGRSGLGIFRIRFDLDWPWPFGAKNKELDFAILQTESNNEGGIKRLVIDLEKKGTLLKTFRLDLKASGNSKMSRVNFESKVRFNKMVDAFFSLERFRENIEYRVIKVIQNLQRHAEQSDSAKSESSE